MCLNSANPFWNQITGGTEIIDIPILWKKKFWVIFKIFRNFSFSKYLKISKKSKNLENHPKLFFHKIVNIDYLGTPFGPKVDWDYLNIFLARKSIFDFSGKISQTEQHHSKKRPKRPFLATFFKLHVSIVRANDFMGVRKVAEPRKNDQT